MELIGRKVVHAKYGPGTVTGLKNDVLRVFFDAFGSHSFRYPQAFSEGLKAGDAQMQAYVEKKLQE